MNVRLNKTCWFGVGHEEMTRVSIGCQEMMSTRVGREDSARVNVGCKSLTRYLVRHKG